MDVSHQINQFKLSHSTHHLLLQTEPHLQLEGLGKWCVSKTGDTHFWIRIASVQWFLTHLSQFSPDPQQIQSPNAIKFNFDR